jgi:N-acetylmuramic acid 6-phosphate etherase
LVLNMLSTASMVRLGHVYENLMIGVALTNQKLRDRGLRILAEASGKDLSAAEHALRQSGHNLRVSLVMLRHGVDANAARRRLASAKGNLRRALGE